MCKPNNSQVDIGLATVDDALLAPFAAKEASLIPVLQTIQETLGYLSEASMRQAAGYLALPEAKVWAVATFYAQFRFKPTGRQVISICRGTACHVLGAVNVLEEVQRQLGIQEGETTDDMEYSLQTVACIGCCGLAPALMIGKEVHTKMTPKKVEKLLGKKS